MEVFLGTIQMFGFNFAPRGWMLCGGQIIAISQNQALFSLLGTQYGGNGVSTFALPDLQSRLAVGQGTGAGLSNRVIGEVGGTEASSIQLSNLPSVAIPTANLKATTVVSLANVASSPVAVPTTANSFIGASPTAGPLQAGIYSSEQGNAPVPLSGVTTTFSGTMTIPGGNLPVSVMNPFLAVNFSIALQGIFPSRN